MKKEIEPLLDDLTEEPTPEQIKNAEFWLDYTLPKNVMEQCGNAYVNWVPIFIVPVVINGINKK